MSGGRTIATNAAALAVSKGLGMVLSLLTFAYLTRTLEPDGYGVLAWGLALVGYFSAFVELGLGTLYVREVAKAPDRVRELAGWLFGMRLTLITIALTAFGAVVWSLDRPLDFKITVGILGLGMVGTGASMDWVYHGTQRMARLAVRNVTVAAAMFGGALWLVHGPADLPWAAGVVTGGTVLGSLIVIALFAREYGPVRPRLDVDGWRTLLRSAVPIGAALFLMQIYATIDQLMLGALRTDAEVGWYASGYRVLTAVFVVDQILQQVFLPALAEAEPSSPDGMIRARDYVNALALLGVPLALGVSVFSEEILVAFAGEAYRPGAPALSVLMAFAAIVYISKAWGDSLVAWGRERSFLAAVAAAAVVNVALNVALIPRFGILGAAAATLASGVAAGAGMAVPYRRVVGRLHLGALARVGAASVLGVLVPALGVQALGGSVWLGILVTLPAYAAAALALGAVPQSLRDAVGARFAPSSSE